MQRCTNPLATKHPDRLPFEHLLKVLRCEPCGKPSPRSTPQSIPLPPVSQVLRVQTSTKRPKELNIPIFTFFLGSTFFHRLRLLSLEAFHHIKKSRPVEFKVIRRSACTMAAWSLRRSGRRSHLSNYQRGPRHLLGSSLNTFWFLPLDLPTCSLWCLMSFGVSK